MKLAAAASWLLAGVCAFPLRAGAGTAAPTPPPQIYHIITTPLCARLHDRIRPAVGLILENDRTISKSPPLFHKYTVGILGAQGSAANAQGRNPSTNDSIYADTSGTRMALQQMSYLVSPVAQSIISAQTLLTAAREPTGSRNDDRTLDNIEKQLLETIAFQSASLDLINGFVATQQMGELQHAGEEYLGAIQGNDLSANLLSQGPSALEDPNAPGLPQNPYTVNLAAVPGLVVGYNPVSRILDAMRWIQSETARRENVAAATITSTMAVCGREAAAKSP